MRILLHVCCGPCTIYPLRRLREQGHRVSCFFYNPNIHPFQEFRRRLDAVRQLAEAVDCPMEIDDSYGLTEYLRRVVFHEAERCSRCYDLRLTTAANKATADGFDAFSSTLLYSKYQNHRLLDTLGGQLAAANGIGWHYEDFRMGWQEGIDESIRLGLYRQPYCGCIYSEQERYDKRLRSRKG
ncbi:MAG: epoxyqueuosine reductase QueH [Desulfobulbus sp.]|jgi:predicted adenine nucleotide alpha hydrolase (AANH) superfamily ATPase|uniref:epoxyqueuosine reductase QueH n=1 Tax=Desulfobulbus sp. TaxID=895 RepID=UPI00283E0249|nr:epoxyqueuosine reductase QueH [Desulfobulbus sp.]MDR2548706.1 epoxyqueuosine reductase QueH [Desulfobulbus sp.]